MGNRSLSRTARLGAVGLMLGLTVALLATTGGAAARCLDAGLTPLTDLRQGAVAEGRSVRVAGVVTGVFLGQDQLGGYFLQESRGDGPPAGLFVYDPRNTPDAIVPGQQVQIQARFQQFHGRPQLRQVRSLTHCGTPGLPKPILLHLPEDQTRLPELLGVKVQFSGTLTITSAYSLGRYGSLDLSARGRPARRGPHDPHSATAAASELRLALDDGSYRTEPTPIPYLDAHGTRRAGDTVTALTGILTHAFDAYRLHPTRPPLFAAGNPRPPPPAAPGPDGLRVATLNLENYFLTLGQRGARDHAELERQRAKLSAVIHGLDADILSLAEVENRPAALADLVQQVNRNLPRAKHYQAVAHPHTGNDAIQVALLYRPARVSLDASAADRSRGHQRPPLLAWFTPLAGGGAGSGLGVAAVHFKSKTRCPNRDDVDQGQGCWNQRRSEQARRLLDFIAAERRTRPQTPIVIAGDLNAYALEDPLRLLNAAGKRDLTGGHWPEEQGYTYVYHGAAGRLDYLLAGEGIRVRRAGIWHINADEPPFLSYRGRQPAGGPWRASDHDPVWADLVR